MATAIASKLMTWTAMPATISVARLPDAIRSARARCFASFSGLSFSKMATTASPAEDHPEEDVEERAEIPVALDRRGDEHEEHDHDDAHRAAPPRRRR